MINVTGRTPGNRRSSFWRSHADLDDRFREGLLPGEQIYDQDTGALFETVMDANGALSGVLVNGVEDLRGSVPIVANTFVVADPSSPGNVKVATPGADVVGVAQVDAAVG